MLKVGDKVKVINYDYPYVIGKEGVITEVRGKGQDFPYRVDFYDTWLPFKANEIELLVVKGQQLLFSFME